MLGRFVAWLYDLLSRRAGDESIERRTRLLGAARGRVLEIGAGTGASLPYYTEAVAELVLLDPHRAMLRRARRHAGEIGRAVRIVRGRAEALPFPEASFDTAVCTLVLCSVDDPAQALAEIRRVLRPGGQLIFIEHVRADGTDLGRRQDRWEPLWRRIALGCHPNRRTLEEIEAAGFELVEVERAAPREMPPLVRPMVAGRAVVPRVATLP